MNNKRYTGERRDWRRGPLLDDRNYSNLDKRSRGSPYQSDDWRPTDDRQYHGEYELDERELRSSNEEDSNFYETDHYSYGSPSPSDHQYDYGPGWGDQFGSDVRRDRHDHTVWDSVKSFFGKGPKGYKRSDSRIHEDVCETLSHHPGIDASNIEVKVEDGIVILTGTVDSRRVKRMTEDTVERCLGVKDIRNELIISADTEREPVPSGQTSRKSAGKEKTSN